MRLRRLLFPALCLLLSSTAYAHGVTADDKGFIQEVSGVQIVPFIYLGAKHMITGYDHLLFLAGVVFFLYRMKDVALYVSLFAIGHSATMIAGVYFDTRISSHAIDAIIAISVIYKALDNMGAMSSWLGFQPNPKGATFIFGLCHGFGLATKLQEFELAADGLLANLLAFNLGVEIGQLLALAGILTLLKYWRETEQFHRHAYTTNVAIMTCGFLLLEYQLAGWAYLG